MWLSASPSLELRIAMDEDLERNTRTPPMQAPRSRLLLSCGASILAVAGSACRRVEAMRCPVVGRLARGVSRAAAPVLRPLRLGCLSALSSVDRQLAVAQDVAAVLLPRAESALRKVDAFVLLVESLPAKFDGAVDGLDALVAGAAAALAPAKKRCRAAADVFRGIPCDEEAGGGAAHRDAEEVRKDDVALVTGSLEVITVDGRGGDDGSGGARDETKTIGDAAPADRITGEAQCHEEAAHPGMADDHFTPSSDETDHDGDAAQGTPHREAARPEAEAQEASSDERKGEASPLQLDTSPAAEQCAEGLQQEQDGRSMEVAETHAAEIMEDAQSTEIEKVERQEAVSPDAATSSETGGASGEESNNKDDDLLDLFDEAWQHKLA